MITRVLLDTHILVRWLMFPHKLSREQTRVLRECMRRREAFAISAVTLLEIAALFRSGKTRDEVSALDLLKDLETNPSLDIIPISFDIAAEVAALGRGWLADPADRAIVATARVHGLQLVTADQRIIDSKLVPTVE